MTNPPISTAEHIDGNAEPCPTPLAWQEVVQSYLDIRRVGPIDFAHGQVEVTQIGQGVPLVFLPPAYGTPHLFALIAWLLKDQRQCILLDHPQFAQRPSLSSGVEPVAQAYLTVLESLFGGPVDVYASTYSAQVCLEMLRQKPTAVHRALLQSAVLQRRLTGVERGMLHLGRQLPFQMRRVPLWLSTQLQNHRRWFPPFDETRFGFLLRETSRTPIHEVADRMLRSAKSNLADRLSQITTPVFILQCEGDGRLLIEQQAQLIEALPAAQSDWMYTTGHYPYLTHPHRLVKVLREFFEIPKLPESS